MTFTKFMKATATVFCTVIVATFTACVDQDNSELKTPKSPDDPIIQPAKLNLNPDLKINELGAEATAELTVKADSGTFADKATVTANFKTTVMKDKIQITMDMLEKSHKPLGLNVTPVNNVTKVYSEDFAINDLDTIQAKSTIGMGVVLGHEFTMVVDSIKVTDWRNKTAEKPTAIVAGSKRVDYVPTELTFFCHEVGTGRTNNFKVVTKVQYTTWIPEDGTEFVRDYAKNVRRSVKNFIDSQYATYVEVWKKGEDTWETETNYTNSDAFEVETISLEDLFTTNFDLTAVKPAGIQTGIESKDTTSYNNCFSSVEKVDIYSATRTIGGSTQTTVYRMKNKTYFFKKGSVSIKYGYITPSVKEISDHMNDNNKSDKEGYDMQLFENVVEIAYGVDSTGVSRDRFSENGKVYVKKTVTPQEVTVKSVDVTVTISVADDIETITGKGTITYSDNSTKPVNVKKTSAITYDVDPAWTINGTKKEQTTSNFAYELKSSSNPKVDAIEGEEFTGSWSHVDESYKTSEKVTSNGVEKANGTTMNLANKWILTIEGHDFACEVLKPTATSSNDHLTEDAVNGLTTTYYYGVNHTWQVKDNSKELHPSGSLIVTVSDEVVEQHWYDISDQTVLGITKLSIGQYRKYKSGKEEKEVRNLEYNNYLGTYKTWSTKETSNSESAQGASITSSIVDHLTSMEWNYDVTKGTINESISLDGSVQIDEWEYSYLSGASITMNGDTYTFPARTASVKSVAGNSKSYENDDETGYAHTNTLTMTVTNSGYSFDMSATANGTITVAKDKPVIPEEKEWGAYLGYKACAALSADGNSTIVGITARFEKGSLPIAVKADGTVDFDKSRFEPGSFIYDGATYTDGGLLVNCYTSKDDNFGLLWYRGTNDVQKMKSFTDLTRMDFNWKHNVFAPQKYGELVENNNHFSIPGTNWSWDY